MSPFARNATTQTAGKLVELCQTFCAKKGRRRAISTRGYTNGKRKEVVFKHGKVIS